RPADDVPDALLRSPRPRGRDRQLLPAPRPRVARRGEVLSVTSSRPANFGAAPGDTMNRIPLSALRYARSLMCCALCVLAACAVGSSASSGQRDTTGDEAAIRKLDQQWVQAVAGKDLNRTVSFYAPDARMRPLNAPPSVG